MRVRVLLQLLLVLACGHGPLEQELMLGAESSEAADINDLLRAFAQAPPIPYATERAGGEAPVGSGRYIDWQVLYRWVAAVAAPL